MPLLVGKYVNKIDSKGRVSVPKPFRENFKNQSFIGLYAYPSFKTNAIEACSEEFMARLSQSLEDLDLFSEEHDDLAAIILENAFPIPFDPEGRIVLTKELRDHAGILNNVAFVGRGVGLQIWNPKSYETKRATAFERARAKGATLKLRRQSNNLEEC